MGLECKKRTGERLFFFCENIFFRTNKNYTLVDLVENAPCIGLTNQRIQKTLTANVFRTPILVHLVSVRVNIAEESHKRIRIFTHLFTSNLMSTKLWSKRIQTIFNFLFKHAPREFLFVAHPSKNLLPLDRTMVDEKCNYLY